MNVLLRRDIDLDSITLLLYITLGLIHMVGSNIILLSMVLYFGSILFQILHVSCRFVDPKIYCAKLSLRQQTE